MLVKNHLYYTTEYSRGGGKKDGPSEKEGPRIEVRAMGYPCFPASLRSVYDTPRKCSGLQW